MIRLLAIILMVIITACGSTRNWFRTYYDDNFDLTAIVYKNNVE